MPVTLTEAPERVRVRESETHRLMDTLLRFRELALVVVLVALIVATAIDNPRFLSQQGIRDLLLNATILMLVATGQAVVVLSRKVDLSVGSVLGICAFATGNILQGHGNTVLAIVLAIGLGAGFGLLNGLVVSVGQVPALVVTLGTLYIIRGLDSMWVGSREIVASQLPSGFVSFGHDGIGPIPWLFLVALALLIVVGLFMRNYRAGREFYAMGSNPEAARLAGVPVGRRVVEVYVLCGAFAGLAGAFYMARFGNVDSGTGSGFELTVVSAVVVGGVAFTGGSGSVYGAALGALLITTIGSALPSLGVSSVWQNAIVGFLLLAAIAIDRVVALRVARVLERRRARHG